MFGRSWSVQSAQTDLEEFSLGRGCGPREESRKVSQFLRAVHCGVGGSEDEGNASLRVRLQEGLLPADKKEMQE